MKESSQYLNIEFSEYKQWKPRDMIVISAPTGSGKTHFILNELLPYAKEKHRKIIYFTNRIALKEQLLHELFPEDRKIIDVLNYQQVESLIQRLTKEEIKSRKATMVTKAMNSSDKNEFDYINNQEPNEESDTVASNQTSTYSNTAILDQTQTAENTIPPKQILRMDSDIPYYIIFDEAQYFLSDAEFNPDISNIVRTLYRYRQAVCIFMTATLPYLSAVLDYCICPHEMPLFYSPNHSRSYQDLYGYLLPMLNPSWALFQTYPPKVPDDMNPITFWMKELFYNTSVLSYYTKIQYDHTFESDPRKEIGQKILNPIPYQKGLDYYLTLHKRIAQKCPDLRIYEAPEDYSYVNPVYYSNDNDIVEAILRSPKEDKWLIFVNSIDDGYNFLQNLVGYSFDAVFIHADNRKKLGQKPRREYDNIVKNESFSCRVLITTKILENGVNFSDSALKHMVIHTYNGITFKQMLGRKRRLSVDEKVNVYLRDDGEGTLLNHFKNQVLKAIIPVNRFLRQIEAGENPRMIPHKIRRMLANKNIELQLPKKPTALTNHSDVTDDPKYCKWMNARYARLKAVMEVLHPYLLKLTYDFWSQMALFEIARSERQTILTDFRRCIRPQDFGIIEDPCFDNFKAMYPMLFDYYPSLGSFDNLLKAVEDQSIAPDTIFMKLEKLMIQDQHLGIRQKLSWLEKFYTPSLDPHLPDHWFTEQLRIRQRILDEITQYLNCNNFLDADKIEELQTMYQAYNRSLRPNLPDLRLIGSISSINQMLQDNGIPFHLKYKRTRTKKGWEVEKPVELINIS